MKLTEAEVDALLEGATFGAEMEVPNFNTKINLKDLGDLCDKEFEIINYRGIGNDPKRQYNNMGAEIRVHYTNTEQELIDRIEEIWTRIGYPETTASPTLHVHIRPHALLKDENVELLKTVMEYTYKWAPELLPIISPLPDMSFFNEDNYPDKEKRDKIIDAYRAKYRHRHGKYTEKQMERVRAENTFEGVINALTVKNSKGQPSWNIHTRGSFNFAKLRESDGQTFECRMFSLTQDPEEIRNLVKFPALFLKCALMDLNPIEFFSGMKFPPIPSKEIMDYYAEEFFLYTDGRKCKRKDIIAFLKGKLESRDILLSELGYPEFWEKELDDYITLWRYSRAREK